jgi:hypothetical protein
MSSRNRIIKLLEEYEDRDLSQEHIKGLERNIESDMMA